MKNILAPFALALACFTAMASPPGAAAQYQYNYSSNIWVNSGMNLMFQKRWETARIRAAGKGELADALEGRGAGGGRAASSPAENVLRRAPRP